MDINVKINFLTDTAKTPYRGSAEAAGWDLYADNEVDFIIPPHTTQKIPTGIAIELPSGTFGGIYPRSGLSTKKGLRPANCVGVIDADYRGEIIVALHNDTNEPQTVTPHERVAQLIVQPFYKVTFLDADLSNTERGVGGFGSSGE